MQIRSQFLSNRAPILGGLLALGLTVSLSGCSPAEVATDGGGNDEVNEVTEEQEQVQSVTLQFANPGSETDPQSYAGTVAVWMEKIQESTDGAVSFNAAHGGSLLGLGDMMSGVGSGLSDLGSAQLSTDPATFPLWSMSGIHDPAVSTSLTAFDQTMITRILLNEFTELEGELTDANLKFVFSIASSPHQLITKEPVSQLSDLQGRTIRTYGSFLPILFESAGANTVNMPADELYSAMERGVVEGAYSLPAFFLASSMGEVTNYLTLVGNGSTPPLNAGYHLTMNLDQWNELSVDHKRAFLEAGREAEIAYSRDSVPQDEATAIEGLSNDFGLEISDLPQSEIDLWSEGFPDVWGPLAEDLNSQGLNGTAVVDRYLELAALSTAELEVLYDEAWESVLASIS